MQNEAEELQALNLSKHTHLTSAKNTICRSTRKQPRQLDCLLLSVHRVSVAEASPLDIKYQQVRTLRLTIQALRKHTDSGIGCTCMQIQKLALLKQGNNLPGRAAQAASKANWLMLALQKSAAVQHFQSLSYNFSGQPNLILIFAQARNEVSSPWC